jgi:protein TorT
MKFLNKSRGRHSITAAVAVSLFIAGYAHAKAPADIVSNPIKVFIPNKQDVTKVSESTWKPPVKAAKPWYICASFPTMQDPYWVAAAYGVITEAKRLGVKVDILNAGSFSNLSVQVNHLNDCAAKGADAVLVAPISSDGVAQPVASLKKSGIPVINIIPRIASDANLAGRATLDYYQVGLASAQYLKESVGNAAVKVALFPGPAGAEWASRTVDGFKTGIKGTKIELVTAKYGNTDKNTQYNLIADTLSAVPNLDWIIGNAVAADAAVGAVKAAGRQGKVKIGSTYQTGPVKAEIQEGTVQWALSDNVVWMGSIGIDMAVKALEGTLEQGIEIWPVPRKLTKENAQSEASAAGFAPEGYKPVFSVRP